MFNLMNKISELIYVADVDTYELLYANNVGKELFHIDDYKGKKCYEVLQGYDAPCPFCTNHFLEKEKSYTWEYTNPLVDRHYLLKDRLIDWDGRRARMEIAVDITETEEEKQTLKSALDTEKMMMECVRKLYQETDLNRAVSHMLRQLGEFLSAERAYVFAIQGDRMSNTYEWCAPSVEPQIKYLQDMDTSLLENWLPSFLKHECVIREDIEQIRESSPEEYAVLSSQGIKSLVAAPLEVGGRLSGYFGVDNPPVEKIQNVTVLLHTLRYFLMSTIQRIEDEEMLKKLSFQDTLTGLYNRNRYMQDLKLLEGQQCSLGVVYLDINGLKDVNDRSGHAEGDELLTECAAMMNQSFPEADKYRIGGDEFLILCKDSSEKEFLSRVKTLKGRLGLETQCRAAIGYQWALLSQGVTAETLVSAADASMYEDKKQFYHANSPSNRYRHHNDDLLRLTNPEFLEEELAAGRFLVYLQPKVSFFDRSPVGAEALVRYQAQDKLILPPGQFLPLLEKARLISKIDFFVFRFACGKIQEWLAKGRKTVPLSVNFSRYTLMEQDALQRLNSICEEYAVQKKWLEIEITETVGMAEQRHISGLVTELREAGFTVSMDDFGTNYANLTLLTSIDFDVLKVDKSLVSEIATNPKAQSVIRAIVEICKKSGIKIIAEGIETEEQFHVLKQMGLGEAQGFLFSRPVSAVEYEEKYM